MKGRITFTFYEWGTSLAASVPIWQRSSFYSVALLHKGTEVCDLTDRSRQHSTAQRSVSFRSIVALSPTRAPSTAAVVVIVAAAAAAAAAVVVIVVVVVAVVAAVAVLVAVAVREELSIFQRSSYQPSLSTSPHIRRTAFHVRLSSLRSSACSLARSLARSHSLLSLGPLEKPNERQTKEDPC